MKTAIVLAVLLQALAVQAIRILHGNDDGWAELYTRSFNDALRASGHDVVLSCPAQDQSGSASAERPPKNRTKPCHYNSCPAKSGPTGHNATRHDLNWVNSFPVTAIQYGIQGFGPEYWGGLAPELAVVGPNVGRNVWLMVPHSGTVAVAAYAAGTARIPAIAFSGGRRGGGLGGGRFRWDKQPVPDSARVYAQLATELVNTIIAAGKPYLPAGVFLNVNFPDVSPRCPDPAVFKWVFSRLYPGIFSPRDIKWCGRTRLPMEYNVVDRWGCYISVSMGKGKDLGPVEDLYKQQVVLDKLKSLLTCLP